MKLNLQANKIFISNMAIDFRKSIDGLCALIIEDAQENSADGLYIFYNKDRNRLKVIGYHNNGFIMIYKRLDKGKFFVTPSASKICINQQELDWLLLGVNWQLLSNKNCGYSTYS